MGHWSQIQLDFVLAGFEKCGSSSLSHNLAKHPEVTFIPAVSDDPRINTDQQLVQDGHLFWRVGGRLLPPFQLVQSFNEGRCCAGGARVAGFSDAEVLGPPSKGPAKHGERNPVYAFQRMLMKMVSLVPGAKVILLVCDPIRWLHSAYADTMNWYAGREDDPPRPPLKDFALADFVAAPKPTSLSNLGLNKWYNLSRRRAFFTFLAEGIVRIFGNERVHMLHRDSLDPSLTADSGIREAYNRLVAFLGLRPFEAHAVFDHKNKRVKANTTKSLALCEDKFVLERLKRYYRQEYARLPTWIGRLGGLVPPGVAANLTSCEAQKMMRAALMTERSRIQRKEEKTRQTKALKIQQLQKAEEPWLAAVDRERGFQLHFAGANEDRLKEARRRQQTSQVPSAGGMETQPKMELYIAPLLMTCTKATRVVRIGSTKRSKRMGFSRKAAQAAVAATLDLTRIHGELSWLRQSLTTLVRGMSEPEESQEATVPDDLVPQQAPEFTADLQMERTELGTQMQTMKPQGEGTLVKSISVKLLECSYTSEEESCQDTLL
eukprot:s4522_g4.t1